MLTMLPPPRARIRGAAFLFKRRTVVARRGVANQDVEAAKGGLNLREHLCDIFHLPHIGAHNDGVPSK